MCGGSTPSNIQLNVALSIQPFSALRSLTLESDGGITQASVAALSSLQQLTSLSTALEAPMNGQNPVDLAEYAHFTGALPSITPLNTL